MTWSHPITSPTCSSWCGCHGNDRCLAMAHWTLSRYGYLKAERMNQFWWNFVHKSILGPQWQSRDQMLKFVKFKMADGRHVRKYWKCHNSPINSPISFGQNLGGRITLCPRHVGHDAVAIATAVA